MLQESKERLKLKSIPNGVDGNGGNDATTMVDDNMVVNSNKYSLLRKQDLQLESVLQNKLNELNASVKNEESLSNQLRHFMNDNNHKDAENRDMFNHYIIKKDAND